MNALGSDVRPLTILIAALGGEGGGVLMKWIVACARAAGMPVQATSVPGVAQRTGSTSYYIEILPVPGAPAPVFALVPMAGRVDVLLASEWVEAGRMLERGFVSPSRTTLIASTSRVYTTAEKAEMGDGRYEPERIRRAAETLAKRVVALDLEGLAKRHATLISATMFGALAGAGVLPWDRATCEAAIGGGRSAKASLAGFAAAHDRAASGAVDAEEPVEAAPAPAEFAPAIAALPEPVRDIAALGHARCLDYQDQAYATLYLERLGGLAAVAPLDDPRGVHALQEAGRRLALWMAYEDIPRVAQLKTRKERFTRIRAEAEMDDGQVLRVAEYLKPGAREVADMLPPRIGHWIIRHMESGGNLPLLGQSRKLATTSVTGFWQLKLMGWMRRFRRSSLRYAEEQAGIEAWLKAMKALLPRAPDFAGALAELPRVLKGYSDTQARGRQSYQRIWNGLVAPALAAAAFEGAGSRLRMAVSAALAGPDGARLDAVLAEASPVARQAPAEAGA